MIYDVPAVLRTNNQNIHSDYHALKAWLDKCDAEYRLAKERRYRAQIAWEKANRDRKSACYLKNR